LLEESCGLNLVRRLQQVLQAFIENAENVGLIIKIRTGEGFQTPGQQDELR